MRTPQGGDHHPEYFVLGKNHVDFVGNSRTPLIQKFLAGKDSFGRRLALGADICPEARHRFQHEEAYVVYDGYLVITSDQKFLVEGVERRTSLGDDPRPDLVQAIQEIYVDYVIRGSR